MVSFEALLAMLVKAENLEKIPPRPDPKDSEKWCEYFQKRVIVNQQKMLDMSRFFKI